jgi:hypothetical protein
MYWLFLVCPTLWKHFRYEVYFHFIKTSSVDPSKHTSPTHSNTEPSVCDIYFVISAVNELDQFAKRHTKREKDTGNIFLLCITNLVSSHVARPCMWYSIFGQKHRSINACLDHHSSTHQFIPTRKHTEGDAVSVLNYRPQPLRRTDAVVVHMLTSRCLCCLLNYCLPKCVPRKAAGPQRRKKIQAILAYVTHVTCLLRLNIYYVRLYFVTVLLTT